MTTLTSTDRQNFRFGRKGVFPSHQHAEAAAAVAGFFGARPETAAVLVTASCARGKACVDSCLDMAVLVPAGADDAEVIPALKRAWNEARREQAVIAEMAKAGKYSHLDLDFITGNFRPGEHGWLSGPDAFELELGNYLVYAEPLVENGPWFSDLKKKWLPYYSDDLRQARLAAVTRFCLNNIDHVAPYVARGLYEAAFKRLCLAREEFLQGLFIARRTYPIAYDKWLREQITEILRLPDLWPRLVSTFEVHNFESTELAGKADGLRGLVGQFLGPPEVTAN